MGGQAAIENRIPNLCNQSTFDFSVDQGPQSDLFPCVGLKTRAQLSFLFGGQFHRGTNFDGQDTGPIVEQIHEEMKNLGQQVNAPATGKKEEKIQGQILHLAAEQLFQNADFHLFAHQPVAKERSQVSGGVESADEALDVFTHPIEDPGLGC